MLRFIDDFVAYNGYSPTMREIGEGVGLSSSSTVHGHVQRLKDLGLLSSTDGLPRTVRSVEVLSYSPGKVPLVIKWGGRTYRLDE